MWTRSVWFSNWCHPPGWWWTFQTTLWGDQLTSVVCPRQFLCHSSCRRVCRARLEPTGSLLPKSGSVVLSPAGQPPRLHWHQVRPFCLGPACPAAWRTVWPCVPGRTRSASLVFAVHVKITFSTHMWKSCWWRMHSRVAVHAAWAGLQEELGCLAWWRWVGWWLPSPGQLIKLLAGFQRAAWTSQALWTVCMLTVGWASQIFAWERDAFEDEVWKIMCKT